MTSIVIIAHIPIASALLAGVKHVFADAEPMLVFDIRPEDEPEDREVHVLAEIKNTLIATQQVLIFTDLIGATPSNIGMRVIQGLRAEGIPAELITGTNICMLLSAVRYRDLPLNELETKVLEAGKRGMQAIHCDGLEQ